MGNNVGRQRREGRVCAHGHAVRRRECASRVMSTTSGNKGPVSDIECGIFVESLGNALQAADMADIAAGRD